MVTCAAYRDLTPDDLLAAGVLAERGVHVSPVLWDDASADWPSFDVVVVRSPWDYYERAAEFAAWIAARAADGTNLWNPARVLRWNMNKRYLRELERAGVDVVKTIWLEHGTTARGLEDVLDEHGWTSAVIKPGISAGAHRTFVVTRDDVHAHQPEVDALLAHGDVMVQPFIERLVGEGEWSLLFFGGAFSHAVVKRPASGDFRVQPRHGGTVHPATAPGALVDAARRVLDHAPGALMYARVDGVRDGNRLLLMELEVLEPFLFLDADPGAARRFAGAIVARLR